MKSRTEWRLRKNSGPENEFIKKSKKGFASERLVVSAFKSLISIRTTETKKRARQRARRGGAEFFV